MEYKPTTRIVLPRRNGKSTECLKRLGEIFYKNRYGFKKYIERHVSELVKNSR
jgi:hypothetical protein